METLGFWGFLVVLILGVVGISKFEEVSAEAKKYREMQPVLDSAVEIESAAQRMASQLLVDRENWNRQREQELLNITLIAQEKSIGFPWLATAYAEYFELQDLQSARALETKKSPAPRAAEQVREIARARRNAEKESRMHRYLLSYYESLFPWLAEFREPDIADFVGSETEITGGRSEDPVLRWLTNGEYAELSSAERCDLALKRYKSRHKTKWEIGRDYERFVGYRAEDAGGEVYYQGIIEGFDDLGRDLVVRYGGDIEIVQCKYWSREKQIHEKHVFQLHSTRLAYEIDHPGSTPAALLVTSTVLSQRAREFANKLGVRYLEQIGMDDYPVVKCNVSRVTGERIYHLPFDQQYDKTLVETGRGEFYAWSAADAEARGYRRAFRWHGEE